MTSALNPLLALFPVAISLAIAALARCEVVQLINDGTLYFRHRPRFLAAALALLCLTPLVVFVMIGGHWLRKEELLLVLFAAPILIITAIIMVLAHFRFYFRVAPQGMEYRSLTSIDIPWHMVESVDFLPASWSPFGRSARPIVSTTYRIRRQGQSNLYLTCTPQAATAFVTACRKHLPPERCRYMTQADIDKLMEETEAQS